MRSIIVPTDFSLCSINAAKYALALAKLTKGKMVFYHSYFVPVPPPEVHFNPMLFSEIKESSEKQIHKLTEETLQLKSQNIEFDVDHELRSGFVANDIIETAKKHHAQLIVMGTQGANEGLKKYILGTNTADVITKSNTPVLVVPEKATFKGLKKIVLATTFEEIKNPDSLNTLLELSWMTDAEIHFLVVLKNTDEIPSESQAKQYLSMHTAFKQIPHFLHTVQGEDVVSEIHAFVLAIHADILVTLPKKHNFIELMFNKSVTRELAYNTQVPLLCLYQDN